MATLTRILTKQVWNLTVFRDNLDIMTNVLGPAGVHRHGGAEMSPHNHRGQHGHVQVRPEVPHALREACQEPRGGQDEPK